MKKKKGKKKSAGYKVEKVKDNSGKLLGIGSIFLIIPAIIFILNETPHSLWYFLPGIIIAMEFVFFAEISEVNAKNSNKNEKTKLNVMDIKGLGLLLAVVASAIFTFVAFVIKNLFKILMPIISHEYFWTTTLSIVGGVAIFYSWYRLNKYFAIRKLGKKYVK